MQGARKLSFKEFERAVEEIAAEKKVGLEAVQRQIVASGGPKRTGTTQTSRVRLHDDKATYTGEEAIYLITPSNTQNGLMDSRS